MGVPAEPFPLPDLRDGLLDLAAHPQLGAEGPQGLGDRADLTVHILPTPLPPVQSSPLVCQGVDLRLEGVLQHGKLGGAVDTVGLQEAELGGVAAQLGGFFPNAEGQRRTLGRRGPADAQQVQVADIEGPKPRHLPPGTARDAASRGISLRLPLSTQKRLPPIARAGGASER